MMKIYKTSIIVILFISTILSAFNLLPNRVICAVMIFSSINTLATFFEYISTSANNFTKDNMELITKKLTYLHMEYEHQKANNSKTMEQNINNKAYKFATKQWLNLFKKNKLQGDILIFIKFHYKKTLNFSYFLYFIAPILSFFILTYDELANKLIKISNTLTIGAFLIIMIDYFAKELFNDLVNFDNINDTESKLEEPINE